MTGADEKHTLLLVDAGNTSIKWAHWRGGPLVQHRIFRQAPTALLLDQAWGGDEKPQRVIIASVAGETFRNEVMAWLKLRWQMTAEWLVAQAQWAQVTNAYSNPARLGVDRWCGLIAARRRWQGALCIASCGTAMTLDGMDAQGRHQGGLIVPGLRLMQQQVMAQTAEVRSSLPQSLDDGHNGGYWGRDTEQALSLGALNAAAGLIDRCLNQRRKQWGDCQLILTGGDAPRIGPLLDAAYSHCPELVLSGVAVAAGVTR